MGQQYPEQIAPSSKIPVYGEVRAAPSSQAWERCDTLFDLTPLNTTRCKGMYVNQTWLVDCFQFDQRIMDGNLHRHDKKHINTFGNVTCVYRYLEGEAIGRTGDDAFQIRPGMITVRDAAQPFEAVQTPSIYQTIYFPHSALGFDPGRHAPLIQYGEGSDIGRLIHAEMDYFFARLMDGASFIEADRMKRLSACIRLSFERDQASRDVRAAARDALDDLIRRHIEVNLKSSDLSANSLLKAFGVSRASLYRMFEQDGGVRKYINDRRLFRAVYDISKNASRRGTISRASEMWGFSSDANFNRAVKRQFGVAPQSLFGMTHAPVPAQLSSSGPVRDRAITQLRHQQWEALHAWV